MIPGALCGPKQGQTSQRQRTGFLGSHRKDLAKALRTRALGIGGHLAQEPVSRLGLQTEKKLYPPRISDCHLRRLWVWGIIPMGSHLGCGLERRALSSGEG